MTDPDPRTYYKRGALIMGSSTLILTFSFIGILALVSDEIVGFTDRVAWYIIAAALVFATIILLLERQESSGRTIIVSALVSSVVSFVVLSLAIEGLLFAVNHPEAVITSKLVLYMFAAGLFGTGITYWGINHWREFSQRTRRDSGL
jgi:drug/metabolite transporter (DMT)-like permease